MLSPTKFCLLLIGLGYPTHAFTPQITNIASVTIDSIQQNLRESAQTKNNVLLESITNRRLKNYQKKGITISNSFVPKEYEAHPFLRNRHFQTIFGVFTRNKPGCAYIERSNIVNEIFPVGKAVLESIPTILGLGKGDETSCDYWDKRERFDTPDGDFFDVDYKFQDPVVGEGGGKATVIIVHGLESNSNSSLCLNYAKSFMERGMDVACVNFRGCSGVPNDTYFQYHAGFTSDLILFLERWSDRNKDPLYITGFSLGANIVMKLLGDLGLDAVTKYNIQGAAVSGAPFDLNFHWRQLIDNDFERTVYAGTLLKSMKKKVEILTERFCDGNKDTEIVDYWKAMNATTIPEIEDAMIAPLYGFKDKFDYYDKSASLPVIDYIAVPTYVINAADDPFFNPVFFPYEKDCENPNNGGAPLKLTRTEHGGHLGHMFHHVDKEELKEKPQPVASFVPMELARFLDHVHTNMIL